MVGPLCLMVWFSSRLLRTVNQREERHRHEEGHDSRLLCYWYCDRMYVPVAVSRWDDDGQATKQAMAGVCVLTPDPLDQPTQSINQSPPTKQNARAPSSSLGPTGSGGASPGGTPQSGPGRSRPGGRRRRRGGSSVFGVEICG